jgi:PST family polysaccharide transporter
MPLTGASLMVFAMLNVDSVIVGRTLGPVALGLYAMAFNLSSWPVQMFAFAVRRVSLAGFSQLVDHPLRLRAAYLRSMTLLTAISLPACVLLSVLAEPAVVTVYGAKWRPAAAALTWLALLAIVRIFTEVTFDYILAWGRARAVFGLQLLWVAAMIPALIVGAQIGGIAGAGIAHLLVALAVVVPAFGTEILRTGIRAGDLVASMARPAVAGLLAAAISAAVSRAVSDPVLTTFLAGTAGFVGYLVVVAPVRHLGKPTAEPLV